MSLTVWAPVTRVRGTALWVLVLGRFALDETDLAVTGENSEG